MIVLSEVSSTSDWLLARAEELPEGTWVRAERQTAGRGRQGRAWSTCPGNLAASGLVHLRADDGPAEQLGFAAGIALHETLSPFAGAQPMQLKWPNDLLLGDGKLAGILLERQKDRLVIGIGVNLAEAPDVPGRTTAVLPPPAPDPDAVLARLAAHFACWLRRWRSDGFEALRPEWTARAHPAGTSLRVSGPPAVEGRFHALAADGALRLATAHGLQTFHAGDVLLAGRPGAA